MKVVLISMPDVAAVIMHEAAFHMPNLGIASLAGNLDDRARGLPDRSDPQAAHPAALPDPHASKIRPELVGCRP
jgi:hypothetical protein